MKSKTLIEAADRVADALFQQAKAQRAQVKAAERQLAISEEMRDMQKANLAVTRQLESALAIQAAGAPHGNA